MENAIVATRAYHHSSATRRLLMLSNPMLYTGRARQSVGETTRSLGALAFQFSLVGSKRSVADLLDLCALVLFRQAVLAAELQTAMWALADEIDGRILALTLCTSAILTTLLGAATKSEHKVERGLLLDVVVGQSTTVFELLAGKDETLLVRWDALLVLDLGLDVVNGVRGFDFQGDSLAGQGLDKDLHTTAETEDKVKSGLLLDVVVREGAPVLELLTSKDETLLVRGNALLVLNLGLDVVNGVRRLDLEGDGLAG